MTLDLPFSSSQKSRQKNPDDLKKIVRDLGLKITQQRLQILKEVMDGPNHVSAQSLFEKLSKKDPTFGFATVYRFLRTLADQGYLNELRTRGLPVRYEWALKEHHDHLTCMGCGLIVEFENQEIENLQLQIANQFQFKLIDHSLELFGYCPRCQNTLSAPVTTETHKVQVHAKAKKGSSV